MFKISGAPSSYAETTATNPFSGRGSSSQNARRSGSGSGNAGTTTPNTGATGAATPESFASHLQVWDPFTGRYYAEGEVPKTVLHTQDSASAMAALSLNTQPVGSYSTQGVPESIRLDGTSAGAVAYNSARSVTASNATYNREATEAYQYQLQSWKDNDGRRWLNGQWTKTEIPPPPPILKETNFEKVLQRISSEQLDSTPIPYYMGNSQAGQIYDYNAPLTYSDTDTTTFEVSATGQRLGDTIATLQGQQFAPNVKRA